MRHFIAALFLISALAGCFSGSDATPDPGTGAVRLLVLTHAQKGEVAALIDAWFEEDAGVYG